MCNVIGSNNTEKPELASMRQLEQSQHCFNLPLTSTQFRICSELVILQTAFNVGLVCTHLGVLFSVLKSPLEDVTLQPT